MTKALADLITELESEVPAVGGYPTTDQYEQAIKDAVSDFSLLCGLQAMAQLSIVSGTASYTLASNFIKMIWLAALTGVDGIINSPSGLIPVSANWEEIYTIAGGAITFTPTPTYSMTRDYRYKSAWILNEAGEEYETMDDQEARIVMMKAKANAQDKQRQALSSSGGLSYSFGAVKVDKGSGASDLKESSKELGQEFQDACDSYNGAVVF